MPACDHEVVDDLPVLKTNASVAVLIYEIGGVGCQNENRRVSGHLAQALVRNFLKLRIPDAEPFIHEDYVGRKRRGN